MLQLQHYESYKGTEYDWLPVVPESWERLPIRTILSLSDERNRHREDLELLSVYREYGVIRKSSRNDNRNVESQDLSKYKYVEPDFLVMNKMKMWQGSLGISELYGIVSPAYIVCRLSTNANLKYLHMLLRSPAFKTFYNRISYGIRVGQWDMHYDDFKKLILYMPSQSEQEHIVRFIDWKTSEMIRFVKEKKREIRLLKELRLSLIDNAVTHGINPTVSQKDSGHAWIGNIPEHWEMLYSKKMFALRRGKALPGDEQLTSSQKYGIISQKEFMRIENRRLTVVMTGDDILKHVEAGDFVISMRSFQGGIEYSTVSGKISSAYVMLIPNHDLVNGKYFKWLLKSPSYIKALQGTSDLVRDGQALRYSNFAKVYLPHVPLAEQETIADYLDIMCPQIDEMINALRQEIIFVQELRTKTISDVVTGKVDVRNVKIPQYELETEELADEEEPDEESGEENDENTDEEVDE